MATYYNITATVAFDQIEANTPQEAAAKAHALIAAQLADPERIIVWEKAVTASGGIDYTSTVWTYSADPQQIVPPAPQTATEAATEATEAQDVPLPVTVQDNEAAAASV